MDTEVKVRMTPSLKRRIKAAADKGGQTMNAEIVRRLAESAESPKERRGKITLRLEDALREKLEAAAAVRKRSVTDEIEARLSYTISLEEGLRPRFRALILRLVKALQILSTRKNDDSDDVAAQFGDEIAFRTVSIIADIIIGEHFPTEAELRARVDEVTDNPDRLVEDEATTLALLVAKSYVRPPPPPALSEESRRKIEDHIVQEIAQNPDMQAYLAQGYVPKIIAPGAQGVDRRDSQSFTVKFEKRSEGEPT